MAEMESAMQKCAFSDAQDILQMAHEPLATLQIQCGGGLPGRIAIPGLLELVRRARQTRLRLAQLVHALNGEERVSVWVEVRPRDGEEEGCDIFTTNWRCTPALPDDENRLAARRLQLDCHLAEIYARLDADQAIMSVECLVPAEDTRATLRNMHAGTGQQWTDFVQSDLPSQQQPLHWRLLDGAKVKLASSDRDWVARLVPEGGGPVKNGLTENTGFGLYFVPQDAPYQPAATNDAESLLAMGKEIAPALRQPISRIIANAETIRTRLAGPLAEEYSNYAADIVSAGQHLLSLVDDLSDLEVVEAAGFSTASDCVDLGDIARRAAGILAMRAQERKITVRVPDEGQKLPAIAEFRRVLQILLNLIGNALRYAPEGTCITVGPAMQSEMPQPGMVRLVVADEGPGLPPEDRERVFNKYERLGRAGDGGTGLGLYISRRLARAMGGELSIAGEAGQGAHFLLDLPSADQD